MGLVVDKANLHLDVADVDGARFESALRAAGQVILDGSLEKVPKESGDLASSGRLNEAMGGRDTIAIEYTSVYARWIHEHLHFKHPHGGQAKFLESALVEKADEALQAAADELGL